MNDEKYKDTLQACFYGDKGAYNQCMYEFQHRGLINNQLQSNWNSLRQWVQKHYDEYKDMEQEAMFEFDLMLDKMNELEGKDKK